MLEGLYSAAAGMAAQQQQLDAIGNDIANLNTSGYRSLRVGFRDLLYNQTASPLGGRIITGAGAGAEIIGRDQAQGGVDETGRPLDVAISGQGYLQVRRADGKTALTRNGALEIDGRRQLTTGDGDLLVPPVTIPAGVDAKDLRIAADGTVFSAGKRLGKIGLFTVPAPDHLIGDGSGLLLPTAASGAVRAATGATLQQGALESSNVDLAGEMVALTGTQRNYTLASEAIQIQEQMSQIANGLRQ